MRTALALLPLLALGACNVSTNGANNSVTVQYNSTAAQDAVNTVSNTAQNVANDIGSDVKNTGDKLQNSSVKVETTNSSDDNKTTNKAG
jgi:hypothetical protein